MVESVDDSPIPGLNLADNPLSEDIPTLAANPSVARQSDRVQKLLEIILWTFRFDFERLPPEARQAYTRFQENKSYREFSATSKRLILDRRLDNFMEESANCLIAATKLFDSRYPHLGLKKRRDGKDLESGKTRAGSRAESRRRMSKSPRRAQKEALRDTRNEQAGESSRPLSRANSATTLALPARTRTGSRRENRLLDWSQFKAFIPQPTTEVAGPSTDVPSIQLDPAEPMESQEDQPIPTERPMIPGFVISTRTRNVNRGSDNLTTEVPEREQSRRDQNEAWLKDYIEARGGTKLDFNLYPYKGWKIEPPEILLHRARNFLADEDIDRTLGWGQKIAELTEYFSYLIHNWHGEEWGAELHEAIDMLRTHWIFEQYHYGAPKLNLKFDNVGPKHSKRLPPVPGAENIVEKPVSELGQRKLLLNKIQPAIDAQYKLRGDVLEKYVELYSSEVPYFWGAAPRSQSPRHELAKIENNTFEKCVHSDMSTTGKMIGVSEAKFKLEYDREHFSSSALQSFATLRGSRRAALQQTLNHLDNSENLAVCNVFRTLILPPPRIPEKPDAGILFPTIQVANVPEKESRDPFSYTVAHRWYLEAERFWESWSHEHAIKACYGHKLWEEREEPIVDLPKNYMGPFVYDFMDHDMKKTLGLLRRCETLLKRISLQNERVPRPFLANMIHFVLEGFSDRHWDETKLDFKGEDLVPGLGDVAYIRPLEEDFLRLLGTNSIHSNTVNPRIHHDSISPRSAIFEQRIMDIMYPKGSAIARFYNFDDFMVSLNAVCDGPVKRWRFSIEEALEELRLLDQKRVIKLNHDNDVSCIVPNLHPEQRVRWLDTDDDLDAFMQGFGATNDHGPEGEEEDDSDDRDEIITISTGVSVPETEDFGNYMFGLPQIENLRSWEEVGTLGGREASEKDTYRTDRFYQRLCFRLGRSVKNLRKAMETYRAQLTRRQRQRNRGFLKEMVRDWESETRRRPESGDYNPNLPWNSSATIKYSEIMRICQPEDHLGDFGCPEITYGCQNESYRFTVDVVRKAIIREAYENKSMLFPSRIDRTIDEKGLRVQSPRRREPVWSFAHPDRRGKAPRYWDISRWPLHLQSESTAEKIRSGGFHKGIPMRQKPEQKRKPRSSVRVITPPVSPISHAWPIYSRESQGEASQETQGETQDETQGEKYHEVQPEATTAPDMTESKDKSENQAQVLPGLGEYTVTFKELAESRRTFTPGSSQYLLGDTPLQKKAIEDYIKKGIETVEPRTWRERLEALFSRGVPNNPGALPQVNACDIPKSWPRSDSGGSGDESDEEVSSTGSPDVEMGEPVTELYGESEAGPSTEGHSSRAQAPSPIIPIFSNEPVRFPSVSGPEPEIVQGEPSPAQW
ncbi:hypothetical protein FBEOM_2681 [Fusarium beomiforme]|uniref:Uncharacterized protein n=1 Tax=Fusarium beomiforme TaxID=44412 RepID=A0A9P5AR26_9HYPO|nr:hypothetical protein FBEOM_2681 [Fusarium beomiforme]